MTMHRFALPTYLLAVSFDVRTWHHQARSERGSALIEMALVSPLLLLLVFGAGDFGRIMYHAMTLTNAARAGAAFAVQTTGYLTNTADIQLAAEQEAQNIGPITVTSQRVCECPGGTVVSCTGGSSCAGYGAVQGFVEVTATTTFTPLTAAFPGIPGSTALTRVAKMRAQ